MFRHDENQEYGRVSGALMAKVVASELESESEASNGEISPCTVDFRMRAVSLKFGKAAHKVVNNAFSLAPFPCQHTTQ